MLAQSTKNQFYLIEVAPRAQADALDLGAAGRFRAWSHVPVGETAWVPSGTTDGLPAHGGFGWRPDPRAVAARLQVALQTSTTGELTAPQLEVFEPRLAFLSPVDWSSAERALRALNINIRIDRDAEGQLQRLALLRPMVDKT